MNNNYIYCVEEKYAIDTRMMSRCITSIDEKVPDLPVPEPMWHRLFAFNSFEKAIDYIYEQAYGFTWQNNESNSLTFAYNDDGDTIIKSINDRLFKISKWEMVADKDEEDC